MRSGYKQVENYSCYVFEYLDYKAEGVSPILLKFNIILG